MVRKFYDEKVDCEWKKLERHKIEYELTKRFLKRYIKPMDKVLNSVVVRENMRCISRARL
ncbi:hypothetical protein [Planococcus antarcticus]|uniref:hypothetical protein n=1 Tax=Planococcus antarcticus TaxID=161360 RepID=UPI0002DB617B|nr:hypothetical protein [Planococcus antarcticus]